MTRRSLRNRRCKAALCALLTLSTIPRPAAGQPVFESSGDIDAPLVSADQAPDGRATLEGTFVLSASATSDATRVDFGNQVRLSFSRNFDDGSGWDTVAGTDTTEMVTLSMLALGLLIARARRRRTDSGPSDGGASAATERSARMQSGNAIMQRWRTRLGVLAWIIATGTLGAQTGITFDSVGYAH